MQGLGEDRNPIEVAERAGLTPLTGRDHEISLLKDRWEQAQEGMGQVVLLIGEPGLGKSRLVYTLKEHVLGAGWSGKAAPPVVGQRQAHGLARHRMALFAALPEQRPVPGHRLLRAGPRLRPRRGAAGPVRPVGSPPGEYDLAQPEIVPLCASLLSLPPDDRFPPPRPVPGPGKGRDVSGVAGVAARACSERRPVLFVVEDLHWVDASTLEFLGQFLAEGLHDRILTLLTFRPEFQTPWPAVAHQTSLALNRLTRRQVGDLMRKKAGGALPEAVVDQVYDRTGGVPLFVEEFTKMVQESGVLDQAGEDSTRVKALMAREIPATLQDLVMARLDRMEGDREVAQLAAVLGREFSYELLAAVRPWTSRRFRPSWPSWCRRRSCIRRAGRPDAPTSSSTPSCEDALYNALVKGKRQQFHRRIAEVLEAQFPQTAETQPELLGHHFTEAGLTEKAVGYWLKAGLRSRERVGGLRSDRSSDQRPRAAGNARGDA